MDSLKNDLKNYKNGDYQQETDIAAIDELIEYHKLGTLDELKKDLEELERWRTEKINENIKNPFVQTSTLICSNCDHKDGYIAELEFYVEKLEKKLGKS